MANEDQADNDEFMNTAQGGHNKAPHRNKGEEAQLTDDGEDVKQDIAGVVQYTIVDGCYLPVGKTIGRLLPGAYEITEVREQLVFQPRKLITDQLIRLPDSKSEDVIEEISKFWTLEGNFKKFGYTHKRGFLLWGPPGSGKTCTVATVTQNMIQDDGFVLLANGVSPMAITMMLRLFREVEPGRHCMVVLEDIDTIIERYNESAVLSLLDGENSIDGVVYMATTNYPENLDGRVINRPSRFDRVVKIGMPSPAARKVYLKARELGLDEVELDRWVARTNGFSLAHLKEVVVAVLCFGDSLEATTDRLRAMARKVTGGKSGDGASEVGFSQDED